MTKARDGCRLYVDIACNDKVVMSTIQEYEKMRYTICCFSHFIITYVLCSIILLLYEKFSIFIVFIIDYLDCIKQMMQK